MQIKVSKDILIDWVALTSEISVREPGTASHEIKFMADGDVIYVASTNAIGSQYITGKMEGDGVEVVEAGAICIPGKPLKEALALLKGDAFTLISDGSSTQVSGGGGEELVLCGMDPSTWAVMPKMSGKAACFDIPVSVFREIHSLMGFGCSKDQTRAPMTSMFIEVMPDGAVHCTSTDQQRVSFYTAPAGTATSIEMGRFDGVIKIAMPVDAAACVSNRVLSHVDGLVGISVDASKVMMSTPIVRFFCSQEAGSENYPRMRDLLRDKVRFSFSASRAELTRVSKLIHVVASKSVCRLDFDPAGSVLLSGKGKVNKSNRSKQSVALTDLEGDMFPKNEIIVSSEDLNEAISALSADDVRIGLTITNNDTLGSILTIRQGECWRHLIFQAREVD